MPAFTRHVHHFACLAALGVAAPPDAEVRAQAPPPACVAAAPRAPGGPTATDSARGAQFREALAPCMQAMHAEMHAALDAPNGDADAVFAAAMIPHHQGAVDMARQLLVHGHDPELRAFALGIIADQQAEIGILRSWVARHRPAPPPRPDTARSEALVPPIDHDHAHPER